MQNLTKALFICTLMNISLSGYGVVFHEEESLGREKVVFPLVEQVLFQLDFKKLPQVTAETLNTFRQELERAIHSMQKLTYVPYVWGGRSIGVKTQCEACRECLVKRKVGADTADEGCSACQKCGIDCSNFAHQLFEAAHLEFPYLTSKEMAYRFADDLYDHFSLVDIGSDLRFATRGDLIVQDGHVVIYLGAMSDTATMTKTVSYMHSSRRGEDERPAGGINTVEGRPFEQFQRTIVRILRHKSFAPKPHEEQSIAGMNAGLKSG